jgi:hypothetical protein
MAELIPFGSTSQTVDIMIFDSSSTVGAGLSGIAYNTTGFKDGIYYRKGALGTPTKITLATLATVGTAWASGGFIEVDATNQKGIYRLDLPDVVVDTSCVVTLYWAGGTNVAPSSMRIDCRPPSVDLIAAPNATALNAIADALLDRSAGVETSQTVRQAMRLMLAGLVGKLSGAGSTSIAIRDTNDTKNRISATVDSSGNRSAITLDNT